MTPGDAYRVGVARPRKPATRPVVVSHRPIVNSNLPVSYSTRAVGCGDTYLRGDGVFAAMA